jgi:hypothetical protein
VRSSIPIQCVCAVERVDENAFQQQHVLQVVTQDNDGQMHTIYTQCKVLTDLQSLTTLLLTLDWVDFVVLSFHHCSLWFVHTLCLSDCVCRM